MEIEGLDPEIKELVEAMNKFSGIRTHCSCYGHVHTPVQIFFVADSLEVLPELLYFTDA